MVLLSSSLDEECGGGEREHRSRHQDARRALARRAGARVRDFVRDLGPGLTTGAADDDPSGISTYSIAGAAFGFTTLWTVLFTVPFAIGVQLTCARIELVTGRGLAGVLRARYPSLGLVGAGLLGVPVLAGSSAYAIAEAGGWRAAMDGRPTNAKAFYATLAGGLLLGMLLDHSGVSGIRLLFWAAVLNGLLAPPLLGLILVVSNDRRAMGSQPNGWVLNALTAGAALVMTAAAVAAVWP